MKTLIALIAVFVAVASGMAQSPGSGNIVLQNQATIYSPTIVTPILSVPTLTVTSAGNTYTLTPVVTGTANIVITGGTTSTSLSGTGAVTGALVGNSVFIVSGAPSLPAGAVIRGNNVANSGTASITITVTGTTVITTGTYGVATAAF